MEKKGTPVRIRAQDSKEISEETKFPILANSIFLRRLGSEVIMDVGYFDMVKIIEMIEEENVSNVSIEDKKGAREVTAEILHRYYVPKQALEQLHKALDNILEEMKESKENQQEDL